MHPSRKAGHLPKPDLALAARSGVVVRFLLALASVSLALPGPSFAASQSQLCDAAAARAARETGVPQSVLMAIARAETGRRRGGQLAPWPWTVNMEGKGRWFASRREAQDYVLRHHEVGARSFDVGCFQINFRWHGDAFKSIEAMFEPLENARYAAGFLARLHEELGDWSLAAGAYHSRTSEFARRYRRRFDRIHAGIASSPVAVATPALADHAAPLRGILHARRRPLLVAREDRPSGHGSLVPLSSARRALIPLAAGS